MVLLFDTARFVVRQLIESDIDGLFDLQSNKKAMDMVPDKVMTYSECEIDLEIRIKNYAKITKAFDVWVVIEKSTLNFVGTCALVYENETKVEIGYRFIEQYWGNGVATEITKGLIDYVFAQTTYQCISADVSKDNIGSTKVLQKFFKQVNEGYNDKDKCYDLNFELNKNDKIN